MSHKASACNSHGRLLIGVAVVLFKDRPNGEGDPYEDRMVPTDGRALLDIMAGPVDTGEQPPEYAPGAAYAYDGDKAGFASATKDGAADATVPMVVVIGANLRAWTDVDRGAME